MVSRCSGDNSALFWRHICSPSPTIIHDSSMVIGLQSNWLNCCTLWIVWLRTSVSLFKECNASRIYILLSRKNTALNSVYLPGLGLEFSFLYVETEAKEEGKAELVWFWQLLHRTSFTFCLIPTKGLKHITYFVCCVFDFFHLSPTQGCACSTLQKNNKKGRHNNMLHVYVSSLWKHLHYAMDSALCI